MNKYLRDAILGLGVCGVICTAIVMTDSLMPLWLLFGLALVVV